MRATNHAITGAIIATCIKEPALSLPLALLSHFAQDAIPHFGYAGHRGYQEDMKHWMAKFMMAIDPVLFIPFAVVLLSHHVSFWVWAAAFTALAPDFYDFIAYFVFKKPKMFDWFSKYSALIQYERPWGIWVELIWYVAGLALLIKIV